MIALEAQENWKADCLKWRGEILAGKYAHWCYEWDGLPIDETTPEFEACQCFPDAPPYKCSHKWTSPDGQCPHCGERIIS